MGFSALHKILLPDNLIFYDQIYRSYKAYVPIYTSLWTIRNFTPRHLRPLIHGCFCSKADVARFINLLKSHSQWGTVSQLYRCKHATVSTSAHTRYFCSFKCTCIQVYSFKCVCISSKYHNLLLHCGPCRIGKNL